MALFTVTLTESAEQAIRDGIARGANVQRALIKGMRLGAIDVVAAIKITKLSGRPIKTRTGVLKSSLSSRVSARGAAISAFIGVPKDSPASRYARILEEGGTIVPTEAGALAIPVGSARTPGGSPRYPGGPRSVPGLIFIDRRKQGKPPLLAKRIGGANARLEILFVLVKSVTIPAFKWLSSGIAENLGLFLDSLNDELGQVK